MYFRISPLLTQLEELDIAVLLAKLLEFLERRNYLGYLLYRYLYVHGYYIKQFEICTSRIVTAIYFHNWTEGSDATLLSSAFLRARSTAPRNWTLHLLSQDTSTLDHTVSSQCVQLEGCACSATKGLQSSGSRCQFHSRPSTQTAFQASNSSLL